MTRPTFRKSILTSIVWLAAMAAAGPASAANWLLLQGTEPDGSADLARVWGLGWPLLIAMGYFGGGLLGREGRRGVDGLVIHSVALEKFNDLRDRHGDLPSFGWAHSMVLQKQYTPPRGTWGAAHGESGRNTANILYFQWSFLPCARNILEYYCRTTYLYCREDDFSCIKGNIIRIRPILDIFIDFLVRNPTYIIVKGFTLFMT